MYSTNLFDNAGSHKIISTLGRYSVLEYGKDYSISPEMAQTAYYASLMNVKKRQLVINTTDEEGAVVQAGAMQFLVGDVEIGTNISGAGDLAKKFLGSMVTGETTIKPVYTGNGTVVLEPSFKYVILQDLNDWDGGIVIEDGSFLACDDSLELKTTARTNLSSAVLGGEGLFNTAVLGEGIVALESNVPLEELIIVDLDQDELKIDGSMAVAWSYDLDFTVEKAAGSLVGSAMTKEGFVNVYRGTGKVLIAPVRNNKGITAPEGEKRK